MPCACVLSVFCASRCAALCYDVPQVSALRCGMLCCVFINPPVVLQGFNPLTTSSSSQTLTPSAAASAAENGLPNLQWTTPEGKQRVHEQQLQQQQQQQVLVSSGAGPLQPLPAAAPNVAGSTSRNSSSTGGSSLLDSKVRRGPYIKERGKAVQVACCLSVLV